MPIPIRSVNVSIEGQNQSGKSAFGAGAPYPLVWFAHDQGWERAIYGAQRALYEGLDIKVHDYDAKLKANKSLWDGHDITIFRLPFIPQLDSIMMQGVEALWQYEAERLGAVSADQNVRSVFIDTATMMRQVKADAKLEALQRNVNLTTGRVRERLQREEYNTVNDAVRDILSLMPGMGKNLIFSHHLVAEYLTPPGGTESVETGNLILHGYNKTYEYVDIAMRFRGVNDKQYVDGKAVPTFNVEAVFQKCGYVPEMRGERFDNPTWDKLMRWLTLKSGGLLEFPMRVPVNE